MSTLVFTDARLIDARGTDPQDHMAVIVEDQTINWIGPSHLLENPDGATLIDVRGKTLMPGLIDVHVDICDGTTPNPIAEYTETIPFLAIQGVLNAKAFL